MFVLFIKECKQVERKDTFYVFQSSTRSVKSTIVHFQVQVYLDNLIQTLACISNWHWVRMWRFHSINTQIIIFSPQNVELHTNTSIQLPLLMAVSTTKWLYLHSSSGGVAVYLFHSVDHGFKGCYRNQLLKSSCAKMHSACWLAVDFVLLHS